MNTSWKTGAFSKNSTPVAVDDAVLNEKVVILLEGKNVFGDQIYTYIRMSLRSLQQLRDKMKKNENFMPAEYGEVLAAGRGRRPGGAGAGVHPQPPQEARGQHGAGAGHECRRCVRRLRQKE